MKILCVDRRTLNLQKAQERPTCLFSETALKALYQHSVHHISTLWSTVWKRWQIRSGLTTCHCHNNAKTASGLAMKCWPITRCASFKSRCRLLCVSQINSELLDCFCSLAQSHPPSRVKVIVCDRFWKMVKVSSSARLARGHRLWIINVSNSVTKTRTK